MVLSLRHPSRPLQPPGLKLDGAQQYQPTNLPGKLLSGTQVTYLMYAGAKRFGSAEMLGLSYEQEWMLAEG